MMPFRYAKLTVHADRLGVVASAVCFVHCMVTPVLLSFTSVWAHYLPAEESTHRAIAVLVASFGALAAIGGYRRHRRRRVLFFMAGGLALIFAGAYWGDRLPSHLAEVGVTLAGSCLMITAHLVNHTFCKNCACGDQDDGR